MKIYFLDFDESEEEEEDNLDCFSSPQTFEGYLFFFSLFSFCFVSPKKISFVFLKLLFLFFLSFLINIFFKKILVNIL